MIEKKDAPPLPAPPARGPDPPRHRLVRFQFPRGTGPGEIAKALRELAEKRERFRSESRPASPGPDSSFLGKTAKR